MPTRASGRRSLGVRPGSTRLGDLFPADDPGSSGAAAPARADRRRVRRIQDLLGRDPNLLELGLFSVMWSEHCSYKSSRVHLKTLPTTGPRVVQGPGENAGAVDIGDGLAAVFKIESHNHPSFIEPYQGAATGVGGIIRDIFTMGARPVALLNALALRLARHAAGASHLRGRRRRHRRLRQQHRHPDHRRRDRLRRGLRRQPAGQRAVPRPRPPRRDHQGPGHRGRQPGLLRRRQDRPRRHPRRHHGIGGVRRGLGREAAGGAGRRPLHGEAAHGGVPRGDEDRRAGRHPGHGRGRTHLRHLRDERRAAAAAWTVEVSLRAAARDRHDAVRDHAVGVSGAHAAGGQGRPRARGRGGVREVGPARGAHRPRDRHRACPPAPPRRAGGRRAGPRAHRRRPGLPAPDVASGVADRRAAARLRRRWAPRRRRRPPSRRCWPRRSWRASAGPTSSSTTRWAPTPSRSPVAPPASSASRAPARDWRCRWTATDATATSIRTAGRCWRWPSRPATSPAPAPSRSAPPTT